MVDMRNQIIRRWTIRLFSSPRFISIRASRLSQQSIFRDLQHTPRRFQLAPRRHRTTSRLSPHWQPIVSVGTFALVTSTVLFIARQNFRAVAYAESPEQAVIRTSSGLIPYDEVQRHISMGDCWVIIDGSVYDVSNFLESHPGGFKAILSRAGTDVSDVFTRLHPPDILQSLPPETLVGKVDPETLPEVEMEVLTEHDLKRQAAIKIMPPAEGMFMLQDFEDWAEQVLSRVGWAYYRSAADEERSFDENRAAFRRYFFRPRMLRDMRHGDTNTTFLGMPTKMPVFVSPAAMAKLGHPLGEINIVRAAGAHGIVQGISTNASCGLDEMFDAGTDGQPLVFQLYLNRDRSASEKLLQRVEKLGAKAIIFTVDVGWSSKRTLDVRTNEKPPPQTTNSMTATSSAPKGVAESIGGFQDPNLTWNDISFIRKNTKLPIIVKGVQSIEDVQLCVDNGVEGVILSNHGGRQADYSPAPIDLLYEMRILRPDLFDKIEVMIDGGVRCGADVVKALALGAKAVGIGRPVLYANGTHGEAGVRRVLAILQEEITNTMRNIGANTVKDLKPEMVGPAGPWVGSNRPPYLPIPKST